VEFYPEKFSNLFWQSALEFHFFSSKEHFF
jgi:hypothetical protein